MPSSAAFTVMVPPAIVNPSLLVIASPLVPVTVSDPEPAIAMSADENSVALGASALVSAYVFASVSALSVPEAR